MKKFWFIAKKILIVLSVLFCLALFSVTLTSAIGANNSLQCKGVNAKIDFDSGLAFVNEKEVTDRVLFLSGNKLIGRQLNAIDYKTLERETEKNPYIKNAEVFVNRKHEMVITVEQKRPVLRILNKDGLGYYLTELGERVPLHPQFSCHLAVASGDVLSGLPSRDSAVQHQLLELNAALSKDEFLKSFIDEIQVMTNGEFNLIPKGAFHVIKIGYVTPQMDEKLTRLKLFYKEGINKVGWNKYSTLNLKFDNQVVCEKNVVKDSTTSIQTINNTNQ